MVYVTTDRTIDEAVERVMDNERLDRRDAIALLAQPVADAVCAHLSTAVLPACECEGDAA